MFADSFLANLLIFVIGQAAAWGNMRTGRVVRGLALMVGAWALADLALMFRFVFESMRASYLPVLVVLQAWSLVEAALLGHGRLRRRSWRRRPARLALYREAFEHYLRNDLPAARSLQQRLVRRDPWDTEATLALATTLARAGERKKARKLFRRARAIDLEARFHDVIADELDRIGAAGAPAVRADG
jgi:tetratricopeptide (TPR) repeat protein